MADNVYAGSIIGFSGRAFHSAIINLATYGVPGWGISHVGIVAPGPDGLLLLYESLFQSRHPCVVTGRVGGGTQAHRLDCVLAQSEGAVWHYPYYRHLYQFERRRLSEFLLSTIGTPYDLTGAFRSGGVGLSWIESLLRDQDLSEIFCSEWVAAAYAAVGLHPTDHVSRWNPNRLVRRLRREGLLLKPRRLK
jgi:hypothetical protein